MLYYMELESDILNHQCCGNIITIYFRFVIEILCGMETDFHAIKIAISEVFSSDSEDYISRSSGRLQLDLEI